MNFWNISPSVVKTDPYSSLKGIEERAIKLELNNCDNLFKTCSLKISLEESIALYGRLQSILKENNVIL